MPLLRPPPLVTSPASVPSVSVSVAFVSRQCPSPLPLLLSFSAHLARARVSVLCPSSCPAQLLPSSASVPAAFLFPALALTSSLPFSVSSVSVTLFLFLFCLVVSVSTCPCFPVLLVFCLSLSAAPCSSARPSCHDASLGPSRLTTLPARMFVPPSPGGPPTPLCKRT